jgi:hypothetical protein
MERAAGESVKRVGNRPAKDGNWAENAKKMLFRGNEPKSLLKLMGLAVFGAKNELLFECKKRQSKPKNGHKSMLSVRCTRGRPPVAPTGKQTGVWT